MAAKRFPVEASHILMFARSVGDDNPVYSDEDAAKKTEAGGIIAPPTFAQSSAQFDPDYFLRPKIGQPGKTWEKESARAGKLVFSESVTEYRDQNGELVITARGVGVRTERPVDSKA